VLAYLSRYTHRIAISNRRLIALNEQSVTFKVKNYRIGGPGRYTTMTLVLWKISPCGVAANRSPIADAGDVKEVYPFAELDRMLPQCDAVVIAAGLGAENERADRSPCRLVGCPRPSAERRHGVDEPVG
jgi:hypothetical protein